MARMVDDLFKQNTFFYLPARVNLFVTYFDMKGDGSQDHKVWITGAVHR
jgi:hypothetical protein